MSLITDTLPLVIQGAAESPTLRLRQESGRTLLENIHNGATADITALFPHKSPMPEPVKVNIIGSSTLKHVIERINHSNPVVL